MFYLFERIIELKSDDPVYLVYDTTFNLGDCYVSPIVFKHIGILMTFYLSLILDFQNFFH
jgi:hypothetical protein